MKERERIAKILTRPITQTERNRYARNAQVDEIIVITRLTEALLELAESVDYLKEKQVYKGLDGHGPGYD